MRINGDNLVYISEVSKVRGRKEGESFTVSDLRIHTLIASNLLTALDTPRSTGYAQSETAYDQ